MAIIPNVSSAGDLTPAFTNKQSQAKRVPADGAPVRAAERGSRSTTPRGDDN
jgi:hypothetical protein